MCHVLKFRNHFKLSVIYYPTVSLVDFENTSEQIENWQDTWHTITHCTCYLEIAVCYLDITKGC